MILFRFKTMRTSLGEWTNQINDSYLCGLHIKRMFPHECMCIFYILLTSPYSMFQGMGPFMLHFLFVLKSITDYYSILPLTMKPPSNY